MNNFYQSATLADSDTNAKFDLQSVSHSDLKPDLEYVLSTDSKKNSESFALSDLCRDFYIYSESVLKSVAVNIF